MQLLKFDRGRKVICIQQNILLSLAGFFSGFITSWGTHSRWLFVAFSRFCLFQSVTKAEFHSGVKCVPDPNSWARLFLLECSLTAKIPSNLLTACFWSSSWWKCKRPMAVILSGEPFLIIYVIPSPFGCPAWLHNLFLCLSWLLFFSLQNWRMRASRLLTLGLKCIHTYVLLLLR